MPTHDALVPDGSPEDAEEFEVLLQYLKLVRGVDFTGYKRASLQRRVRRRMQVINVATFAEYLTFLKTDEDDEVVHLVNTILINVTSFFRDRATWDIVLARIIPHILEGRTSNHPIRVWSAGCATGEEAYSLAIAFAESVGAELLHERVKIYATDADEDALAIARLGVYSQDTAETLGEEWRARYFQRSEAGYAVRWDIRRSILFGRNDLTRDVPIARVDLLMCRNTLMYFNGPTQNRVLSRIHFALNEGGYLVLGRAETLLWRAGGFTPIDLRQRIFRKGRTV